MADVDEKDAKCHEEPAAKPRMSRRKKTDVHPIETANKASNDEFLCNYVKPSAWPQWTHPRTEAVYTLKLSRPADMTDEELDECMNLVDETSGAAYRSSSFGWHAAAKKKEMRSQDLRYVVLRDAAAGTLGGFTSMMPTFENNEPVVYCYEIHLKSELQGSGLGQQLMGYLVDAASNIPTVEKVMLTCFVSNKAGLKFYEKLGFDVDEFSPGERKLRGGKVVTPDYVILSRRTAGSSAGAATPKRRGGQ